MNTSKIQRFWYFLTLAATFSFPVCVFGAAAYRLVDLGTLGGNSSIAHSINDYGEVVGGSTIATGGERPFLYTKGMLINLGTIDGLNGNSWANGINDHGQIVGSGYVSGIDGIHKHAFLYANSTMLDLNSPGERESGAAAINDLGHIVGYSSAVDNNPLFQTPFLYDIADGIMTQLPTLGGTYGTANAINNLGQIVGFSTRSDGYEHAFLYDQAKATIIDLDPLRQEGSHASGINDAGEIVGDWIYHGTPLAFWYTNDAIMYIATLAGGDTFATGINNQNQIVGSGWVPNCNNCSSAFVWKGDTITDLNALIAPGSGLVLLGASGINSHGQIVGDAEYTNDDAQRRAFLLNPILHGIDISSYSHRPTQGDFEAIKEDFDIQFTIVAGWQGNSRNPNAAEQLRNARNAGLLTAGFCFLNFAGGLDGHCQVREALAAFGAEAQFLGFLAIDVEWTDGQPVPLPACLMPDNPAMKCPSSDANCQSNAVDRIREAVQEVESVGLRPIIYTRRFNWCHITGDTDEFQNLRLWWAQAGADDLDDPDFTAGYSFGNWDEIAGKQYDQTGAFVGPDTEFVADLDIFDFEAFSLKNSNYTPVSSCPYFTIRFDGHTVIIDWNEIDVVLEEALVLDGPWTSVPDALSPHAVNPSSAQKFYRLRK